MPWVYQVINETTIIVLHAEDLNCMQLFDRLRHKHFRSNKFSAEAPRLALKNVANKQKIKHLLHCRVGVSTVNSIANFVPSKPPTMLHKRQQFNTEGLNLFPLMSLGILPLS